MLCNTPWNLNQTLEVDGVKFALAMKGTKVSMHAPQALLGLIT